MQNALLVDCPFDLYWFDKTLGTMIQAGTGNITYENDTLSMPLGYSFNYRVAETYRGENYVQLEVDEAGNITNPDAFNLVVTTDVSRVETARSTAADIVARHQNESDYDKLLAYKDEICTLTAYNTDAANSDEGSIGAEGGLFLAGVFPVHLEGEGEHTREFDLPGGAVSFKVLLAGWESLAPLCGAGIPGSE